MTTSPTTFLSEIVSQDQQIPLGKLVYFQERQRNRLHNLIATAYKEANAIGVTKAHVARRIHRKPEQITRWLSAPGNLTLDTISDLLLSIKGAELDFSISPLQGRVPANYQGEWAVASSDALAAPPPIPTEAEASEDQGFVVRKRRVVNG